MLKILTITDTRDFKKISLNSRKFHSPSLIILTTPTPSRILQDPKFKHNRQNFARFGYTISKNVDKLATQRNFIKRRLRHIINQIAVKNSTIIKNYYDYVIIAKKQIVELDYADIYNEIESILNKIILNHEKVTNKLE